MLNNKFRAIAVSVIFVAALTIGVGGALAQEGPPGLPPDYSGTVYVGGVQTGAGLNVTVSLGSWASNYGNITDSSGNYWYLSVNPQESVSGTIYFYVNGVQATETASFLADGSSHHLDLHITALPMPISSNVSTSIGPSGGTVNTSDGTITITFPAGAFNASTNVSIQGGSCQHGATADFVVGSTCFNVTPDGELGAAATICVNLSAYDFTIVGNKSDLTLGYWFNGSWVEAGNVTLSSITLCGQTSHLSHWAVLGSTVNGTPGATATPSASPTPTTTAQSTPASSPTNTPGPTHTQRPPRPQDADNEGGTNWGLMGGIIGGAVLLAVIVTAVNSRRRGGKGAKGKRKAKQSADKNKKDEPWDFK